MRKGSRFAVASLVLSIAGLLSLPTLEYLAVLGVPGIIFGLPSIIFGIVALKQPVVKGRGMAIAGIVVGGALLSIWLYCILDVLVINGIAR
jgi:hypothetical protein